MNAKPLTAIAILMPFLFLGCDGSNSVSGPTPSTVTQVSLVPLKVGDKWTLSITNTEVIGGLESLTITKDDSTYNGEGVYCGALAATAPPFTSDSTRISNFIDSGSTLLRKSDQQMVYRYESISADAIPVGSTVTQKVKIIQETRSQWTGSIPTVLTPGLLWVVKEVSTVHSTTYVDDVLSDEQDTVETKTNAYTTKNIYNITVPAGTFAAIEMDHVVQETGESVIEYYSEEAKVTIKETSLQAGVNTVFELRSLNLVK